MHTAFTLAFVGRARVVTSLGQERDIVTQSCPLHLTIETPRGPVRFAMTFIMIPRGGNAVVIGQKSSREKLGMDVMALKGRLQLVLWTRSTLALCYWRR